MKLVYTLCASLALATSALCANAEADSVHFSKFSFKAQADLGDATFTYDLVPTHYTGSVGLQIYVHRDDVTNREEWDPLELKDKDGHDILIPLTSGEEAKGSFTLPMKRGIYGKYRMLLFKSPDGKNVDWGSTVYDSAADKVNSDRSLSLTISTGSHRVKTPVLYLPDQVSNVVQEDDGSYTVEIPAQVKIPANYQNADNGLVAQAKSPAGFAQVWAGMESAQPGGNAQDPYSVVPVNFEMKGVKPGLYNVQFGLFSKDFQTKVQWVWPGIDFEAGGDKWEQRAPASAVPPRLRVKNGKFVTVDGGKPYTFYEDHPNALRAVSFVRGGNYGNEIYHNVTPALDTPEYFEKLKELGCRYMRVNFNQTRFLNEQLYQHVVDQAVQNIWAAGMYPIICPQGLPEADTLEQQAVAGLKVVQTMATKYRGKSVWLEICNEPHEFSTWKEWKPIAESYVKKIRAIDPDAFVIVPFEGFGKDTRSAAADPITDVDVDLYDGHAYVKPEQVTTLFGPAIEAGLPVLIGEYGGGADYLRQMDAALQALPSGLLAAGPWAFTAPGSDSLPLVAKGDGSQLTFTPAGQVIANDYAAWNVGRKRGAE